MYETNEKDKHPQRVHKQKQTMQHGTTQKGCDRKSGSTARAIIRRTLGGRRGCGHRWANSAGTYSDVDDSPTEGSERAGDAPSTRRRPS